MSRLTDLCLFLAVVSFVLSPAVFTPAVYVAWLCAAAAAVGVVQGHVRRGLLAIYFAIGSTIVSPIFPETAVDDLLLVAIPLIGALAALVSWWHYRKYS